MLVNEPFLAPNLKFELFSYSILRPVAFSPDRLGDRLPSTMLTLLRGTVLSRGSLRASASS